MAEVGSAPRLGPPSPTEEFLRPRAAEHLIAFALCLAVLTVTEHCADGNRAADRAVSAHNREQIVGRCLFIAKILATVRFPVLGPTSAVSGFYQALAALSGGWASFSRSPR